jgi:NADH-quinone oxidoreductase subunit C
MDKETLLTTVQDKLKAQFGGGFISSEMVSDFPVFVLNRDIICDAVRFLYDDADLSFQFLTTLAGTHYPDNKGHELGVMYQLHSLRNNYRIRLKVFVNINEPNVPSITPVFLGANWMERQEFDFFGINFTGHPNLKRILNMDEMTYHPMRKEFPLEDGTREDKDDKMFGR